MIITPGKYLTRSGELIAEVEVTDIPGEIYSIYPVRGHMGGRYEWWTANGRYCNNGKEHASDLVARIPDDAPQPSSPERPLTRREQFAMAAMQGFLANPDCSTSFEGFAKDAVRQADALIAELDKGAEE